MKKQISINSLKTGAIVLLLIAVLHAGIIFAGARAYDFFRAGPEMAAMAEAGSMVPTVITLGIILILILFAAYGFSGAGLFPPFPFLRFGIGIIAFLFIMRGSVIVLQIPGLFPESEIRDIVFSLVSIISGILYLIGWVNFNR